MNGLFNGNRVLFLDGAMGTQLQEKGLQPGEIPELWNLSHPNDVRAVHEAYFAAGADAVYANTFGANAAKYHGDAPLADVIAAGVGLAREAAANAGGRRLVALDVGPTGRLLKPAGDFEFDAAYDAFAEQIRIGARAGADLIAIETMGDTYELKAAVLAAKENSSLPVVATVALGEDGKLLTGASPECVAAILEGLRVEALGFNCGLGPDRMLRFFKRLAAATSIPLVVKPNAGMPRIVDGRTVFTVGPEEFAKDVAALLEAGASIVGGCCGTTPAHIAAISRLKPNASRPDPISRTVVTSGSRAVEIPFSDTIIIGERINPTGKKKLKAALTEGDVAYVLREAVSQAEAGAHVLDVNVGIPGLDEPAVLDSTVQAVQSVTDLPLQIDTSDPAALERALRHYNGKALVNSVNGKEESLFAADAGRKRNPSNSRRSHRNREEDPRTRRGIRADAIRLRHRRVVPGRQRRSAERERDNGIPAARSRRARMPHVPWRLEHFLRPSGEAPSQRDVLHDGAGQRAVRRNRESSGGGHDDGVQGVSCAHGKGCGMR